MLSLISIIIAKGHSWHITVCVTVNWTIIVPSCFSLQRHSKHRFSLTVEVNCMLVYKQIIFTFWMQNDFIKKACLQHPVFC